MSSSRARAILPATPDNLPPEDITAEEQARSCYIARLPVELLVAIFLFTQQYQGGSAWVKSVLHVCSHWRNIGHTYPWLWSSFSMESKPGYILEVIRRSGRNLLDAHVYVPDLKIYPSLGDGHSVRQVNRSRKHASAIMGHMYRFRSLNINIWDYLWRPNTTGTPWTLKELNITLSNWKVRKFDISSHWLFSSPLHSLRELRLKTESQLSCVLSLPNLRVLDIDASCTMRRHGWHGTQLLETLRGSPLLETLSINSSFIWPKPTSEGRARATTFVDPVHLPKLRALWLHDENKSPSTLLRHLVVPVEAALALEFRLTSLNNVKRTLKRLRPTLHVPVSSGRTRHTTHRPLRVLEIRSGASDFFCGEQFRTLRVVGCAHAGACRYGRCQEGRGVCTRATLDITLVYLTGLRATTRWTTLAGFDALLDLLPLDEVKMLRVQGRDACNSLRCRLGLLAAEEVPFAEVQPWGLFRPGQLHAGKPHELVELEPITRELPSLRAVVMFVLPWKIVETRLEYEIDNHCQ